MTKNQLQLRTIIIWGVSLVLCVSAGGTIINLWARKGVVRERERELTGLQETNKRLQDSLTDIKGEDYVERVARDKLGMVREGEMMVILPDREPKAQKSGSDEAGPNWKKWVRLFY